MLAPRTRHLEPQPHQGDEVRDDEWAKLASRLAMLALMKVIRNLHDVQSSIRERSLRKNFLHDVEVEALKFHISEQIGTVKLEIRRNISDVEREHQ